ncbi:MAG: hypothetical protein Q9216_001728 [Gyalolechia sp. 2 TL-2023]
MTATSNGPTTSVPVLLLKNPSVGHEDPYTIHLSSNPPSPGSTYLPLYVPVLEHTSYIEPILTILDHSLKGGDAKLPSSSFPFGGFIFTSQRAVEAFASAIARISSSVVNANTLGPESLILERLERLAIPLYAVGPATALSLDGIVQQHLPDCWIRGGEEAGSGEVLADLILRDYNASHDKRPNEEIREANGENTRRKKPLLFLTGAKHRDIIPVKLTSASPEHKIDVEELIVYASTESQSFASDISTALQTTIAAPMQWIVIFSPMAGETLMRALGWLEDASTKIHGPGHGCWIDRRTFIASIGPTTRDYMNKTFGLEVDVCAEKPSPEGVRRGIEEFLRGKGFGAPMVA